MKKVISKQQVEACVLPTHCNLNKLYILKRGKSYYKLHEIRTNSQTISYGFISLDSSSDYLTLRKSSYVETIEDGLNYGTITEFDSFNEFLQSIGFSHD